MPLDRRPREQLARVLAAHMRDSTDARHLLAQLRSLHEELARSDPDAAAIADDVIFQVECRDDRQTLDTPQNWDDYRRRIAFLLCDLPLPPNEPPPDAAPPDGRMLARTLLAVMVVTLAIAPWTRGYPFFACWLISPAMWLIATTRRRVGPPAWPFESSAQWHAHERRLHSLDLPSWESSPHFRKPIPRWRRMLRGGLTKILLFGAVYLLTSIVWPLSVIAMSFPREVHAGRDPHPRDPRTPRGPRVAMR